MRPRSSARPTATYRTRALLLKRVEVGEFDLIVTLFTEDVGLVSAIARAARKSRRRFGGGLEPFHTLRVRLAEATGQELLRLEEAELDTVRHGLVHDLSKLEAAGHALAWVKRGAPARTAERRIWDLLIAFLDALDGAPPDASTGLLAACGVRLLSAFGWGLDLTQCVRCGRPCGPQQPASVDAARGGLVCTACGGGPVQLSAAQRARLIAAEGGDLAALAREDAGLVLSLVERALDAHSGRTRA